MSFFLDHTEHEIIDEVLAVAEVSALDVVAARLAESAFWCIELEWPEEPVSDCEVWSACVDFVGDIFDGLETELS